MKDTSYKQFLTSEGGWWKRLINLIKDTSGRQF